MQSVKSKKKKRKGKKAIKKGNQIDVESDGKVE